MPRPIKIVPSILSADFARLGDQIAEVEAAGADAIQCDVMDGRFVPNITFGPLVVQAVRRSTHLPIETHLMIVEPERYAADFARAGSDTIIVHAEVSPHLHRTIQHIHGLSKRAGVAINPSTALSAIEEIIGDIDLLLVMTVNPGFGGQGLIERTLDKMARAREMLDAAGSEADLEADGGVSAETVARIVAAGANHLVAGSAVFEAPEGVGAAIERIRRNAMASLRISR
ncbi:MAG TPA: ribulose-phosphate 3-epimerase [Anaerolineae bacterium]